MWFTNINQAIPRFKHFRRTYHSVKIVRIRSFSGPYFPALGLNTERYSVFSQNAENTDEKNSELAFYQISSCENHQ